MSAQAAKPSARRQLALLLGVWWRHMRRKSARVGEAPKRTGIPTFLLINLLSIGYLAPVSFRTVTRSMRGDEAFFAWHMAGILLLAFGDGVAKGGATLRLHSMRDDTLLEALPFTLAARVGLQLIDGVFTLIVCASIAVAGAWVSGASAALTVACALTGYVASFMLGHGSSWLARVLGPPSTARYATYVGIGGYFLGFATAFVPFGEVARDSGPAAALVTRALLGGGAGVLGVWLVFGIAIVVGYRVLVLAERSGFDRMVIARGVPKAAKGALSRFALERRMALRQGGKVTLFVASWFAALVAWLLFKARGWSGVSETPFFMLVGICTYFGAILTIGHAGRAARSDLAARPFLSALPLLPHEVLDGKARILRLFLTPILVSLLLMAGFVALRGELGMAYRVLVTVGALYMVASGAIALAFLASGIGVIGVGGAQASSSFFTQTLLMPLLATVLARDAWAATLAALAVLAVALEAQRAAKLSVRWIDDADDAIERETTVWRALLAMTVFFSMQILSVRALDLFDVPFGYSLAFGFTSAALTLALLTWRNAARFERPRFMPRHVVFWPLGALGGAASGFLALQLARLMPKSAYDPDLTLGTGEAVAAFVAMVVVAPLAEEYFFRGWLQRAIENDLPARHKRWAVVLSALAFALAHVGSYGVPQLVFGLVAGVLYASGRGLWPAILAHAVHNGVAVLAAP